MSHTRKIGVFISHIFGYYQQNLCQGIIDRSAEYGYTAEIYTSMDGEDLGTYGKGERSILRMPNYADLDGIIFAPGTYPLQDLRDEIQHTLSMKCRCPIIEIADRKGNYPVIHLENNTTCGLLTDHMIEHHNYKRICFLGNGIVSNDFFSSVRETAFRKSMSRHDKEIGPYDIYSCGFSTSDMEEALAFFLRDNTVPNAIICYNDDMALAFMRVAIAAGYSIPEDIAITGCDDTEDGKNTLPALTTVSFPCIQLGASAVDQLMKAIHGKPVEDKVTVHAQPIIRNSCGCSNFKDKNPIFFAHSLNNRIAKLERSIFSSMNMSAAFESANNIDEGIEMLSEYFQNIEQCNELYMCLYSDWDSISSHILELTESTDEQKIDSDDILLKLAIKDGKRLPECVFKKTSLLPEYIYRESQSSYIFTPLFFEEKAFGYIALAYKSNRLNYHFHLVHWFMDINQMLQKIRDTKRTELMVNHLEQIYQKDALTGLYNLHGYQEQQKLLIEQASEKLLPVTCFLFDLDGLKTINDNFGHNEGDFAIQVLGHALENTMADRGICARYSGDEFYLLAIDFDDQQALDFLDSIQKYLDNYNRLSSKEYFVSSSGGHCTIHPTGPISPDQIQEMFRTADEEMYRIKKNKTKQIIKKAQEES